MLNQTITYTWEQLSNITMTQGPIFYSLLIIAGLELILALSLFIRLASGPVSNKGFWGFILFMILILFLITILTIIPIIPNLLKSINIS